VAEPGALAWQQPCATALVSWRVTQRVLQHVAMRAALHLSSLALTALGLLAAPAWAEPLAAAGASSSAAPVAATLADQGDPALDEHVSRLTAELRCLVCQNQTIADSQAELAVQLKHEVRQQLAHGASDQQVRDFMVQRYGDFVLYRPPVNASTILLWVGPALLLLLGGGLLLVHWRERRQAFDGQPDSVLPTDDESRTSA
jgi:cytochrome c-type biogenesis protein CcmH